MSDNLNELYLAGIREGDSKILKKLYEDVGKSITSHVLRNSGTIEDGGDFFRLAVLKTRKKIMEGSIKKTDHIAGFIYGVAKNDWQDHLRRVKKRAAHFDNKKSVEDFYDLSSDEQTAEQIIIFDEKKQLLRNCISTLSEKCKQFFELHFYKEMKLIDIAEQLGGKEGTIRKRKSDCLGHLRECMKQAA